jgi:hypothetical protein
MAIRDLTQDYINLRNSKLSKPFSSSKKQNLDDDREELNYVDTNGKLSEDPELGDSNQFEVQPQWVLVLKNVQENMSNIKNGCMLLNEWIISPLICFMFLCAADNTNNCFFPFSGGFEKATTKACNI